MTAGLRARRGMIWPVSPKLPTVSVIVPANNAASVLPRALAAVDEQDYPNVIEVVVAAADDETAAAAGDVIVVRNPSGTTPGGLNLALAASRGEVVVRCDAHSVLPPGYVSRAVNTLLRTGAANVGGMQVPVGETPWERAIASAMSSRVGAGDARYRVGGEEGPVDTVYLGVFRRSPLETVGSFDESFARNQDYELNHRLRSSGEIVWFDPELRVEYTPRGDLGALARQYYEYGRAKRHFARTHRRSLRWRQLAAPALVALLAASLILSLWYPAVLLLHMTYGLGLLGAGLALDANPLRVAAALATMHMSWGIGFLAGKRLEGS